LQEKLHFSQKPLAFANAREGNECTIMINGSKTRKKCVILAAGEAPCPELMKALVNEEDTVIAADGGAKLAASLGRCPDIIIGDFDSLDERNLPAAEVVRLPVKKDDTDTMAAARMAADMGFDNVLMLGAAGGRLDHTFGNFAVMAWLTARGIAAAMAADNEYVYMCPPGEYTVEEHPGTYLSLLPYGGDVSGLTIKNVEYPLEYTTVSPDFPIGISNKVTCSPARISFEKGLLLIFISKD